MRVISFYNLQSIKRLQSQYSFNIQIYNDVKLLLVHIQKMQNIAEVRIFVIDKIILSIKAVVDKKT